jgi:phospholipase/carboxylesterase
MPGSDPEPATPGELLYAERPAAAAAEGLLVLHHGRGTDEHDLLALADALDPRRRLHVSAPRGPLVLAGRPGFHWYTVPRVGHPDPATFLRAQALLAAFHDELWGRTGLGPQQTVLGGFSMGAVMSYALGLEASRPAPAGILAFSGFLPSVPGWQPSTADRPELRAFIAHGRRDAVISVQFARRARDLLQAAGLEVAYHESDGGHSVEPAHVGLAAGWLAGTLGP